MSMHSRVAIVACVAHTRVSLSERGNDATQRRRKTTMCDATATRDATQETVWRRGATQATQEIGLSHLKEVHHAIDHHRDLLAMWLRLHPDGRTD